MAACILSCLIMLALMSLPGVIVAFLTDWCDISTGAFISLVAMALIMDAVIIIKKITTDYKNLD